MFMLYIKYMSNNKRKVNRTSYQQSTLKTPRYTKTQKAQIRSAQRARKLALTQARKYFVYAIACFITAQLIKFVLYNIFFRGTSSPPDWLFSLIVYIQIGLLFATFVFLVLSAFKALTRILTEEY